MERSYCRFSQVAPYPAAIWTYSFPRRAKLLPLVFFRFGDGARLYRTVWRSVLQNNVKLITRPQHHRPSTVGPKVKPQARSFPEHANVTGISRIKRAVAIPQAANKSAARLFTKNIRVGEPPP